MQAGAKGRRLIIRKVLAETFSNTLQFIFSPYNQHPVLDLDTATFEKIEAAFLAIRKELNTPTFFWELVNARCRLIALMISLWMEHQFGDDISYPPGSLAYKFHSLVEKHYKAQKSVAFYAKHFQGSG